jgi:PEP-CTERM motif
MRTLSASAAFLIVGLTTPAFATTFNFPSGSLSGSGFSNSMTLTVDGITVTATAWGLTDDSEATLAWERGQLGDWSTGLGVCNQSEGTGCQSPLHTVDNAGQLDGVLFSFSERLLLDSAFITAWASDYDASYWSGTGAFSPLGLSLAALGASTDDNFGGTATTGQMRSVDLSGSSAADWLFFGASATNSDHIDDRMKIKALTVERRRVPEPYTLSLLMLGLGAIAHRRRRA